MAKDTATYLAKETGKLDLTVPKVDRVAAKAMTGYESSDGKHMGASFEGGDATVPPMAQKVADKDIQDTSFIKGINYKVDPNGTYSGKGKGK